MKTKQCIIIGGGPAGLMAAEQLTQAGFVVDLYDAMPTMGRKFLLAGIGGLNITHSEDFTRFCQRYDPSHPILQHALTYFTPNQLRHWCTQLGIETFVGTSGRVFPTAMKAAPLLRAWLTRLRQQGLRLHPRHRWLGWDEQNHIILQTPDTIIKRPYDVLILALGGGSWKKLGSNGAWLPLLQAKNIATQALQPSNCGFLCHWSTHLQQYFAGAPLKSVTLRFTDLAGQQETRQGELIVTQRGVEGSLIYAFSARLRETLQQQGSATIYLDLCPHYDVKQLTQIVAQRPHNKTLSTFLKTRLKLTGIKTALLFEVLPKSARQDYQAISQILKALPLSIYDTTPMDEAISTAGGVQFTALNNQLMLKQQAGVFCAGEMLDWDAPTGGYLLTACLALGQQAGKGAVMWLQKPA